MTTNIPGSTARQDPRNVSNTLRWRFNFNDPGILVGVQIGVLPQNAFIIGQWMEIITAFNGTTPQVTVGTIGAAYTNLMDNGDVTEATPAVYIPLITGGNSIPVGKLGRALTQAGDTPVLVRFNSGGGATTGVADYVIEFEGGFPDH